MYQKKTEQDIRCPFEYGMNILCGKWKSRLVCLLGKTKPMRYGELKVSLIDITDGVLSATLNELIQVEIIDKINDETHNGMAEYQLTEKGRSLLPFLRGMCRWAGRYYDVNLPTMMTQCSECRDLQTRETNGKEKED